jgi:hypothetical protein
VTFTTIVKTAEENFHRSLHSDNDDSRSKTTTTTRATTKTKEETATKATTKMKTTITTTTTVNSNILCLSTKNLACLDSNEHFVQKQSSRSVPSDVNGILLRLFKNAASLLYERISCFLALLCACYLVDISQGTISTNSYQRFQF